MPAAKLTTKGQITLPKVVRERLHLHTGDRVDFRIDDDGRVELRRAGVRLEALRGILARRGGKPVSVEDMDEAIARVHRKR